MKLDLRMVPALALLAATTVSAQPAGTVKPTLAHTITLHAYADNWCTIFINGKMVATDSIDFLPHNQISVRILPEYPMTIAVLAKDNAEPATGLEYGNRLGDGGFILKLGDGTVTSAAWKAKAFFRGPLNTDLTRPVVEHLPLPERWYAPEFDDSTWEFATEYAAERVGPDGDYDAASFTNARFIWTRDLLVDNTVIFRTTVPKPANFVAAWTTKPDLDVSALPQELVAANAAGGAAAGGPFINLSTRALVGTGDSVLIPGLVIGGTNARRVLVRAVGPTLSGFGVGGVLADPVLTVFRGAATFAAND
ncbi:MAG: hypothetical protein JNL92_03510, partial [Opitutaceae bacterium]|nr:hypothetical protein [Opitutaceae bacterium]